MNRRSILSALCTGALALLAPVVAWAKPHRKVRFVTRGVKGIILGRGTDHIQDSWVWDSFDPRNRKIEFACTEWSSKSFPSGPTGEYPCSKCGQPTLHDEPDPASLRALLAEAREVVARKPITFKQKDGATRDYIIPLDTDADLLARIDAALKEKV